MAGPIAALGYQQLTVSTVAVALTVPAGGADTVLVRVQSNSVRYRDDGTNPTSSVGVPLTAGETLLYPGQPEDLKFIRSGAADAVLEITYYNADTGQYPQINSGGSAAAAADASADPTAGSEVVYPMVYDRAGGTWNKASAARDVSSGGVAPSQLLGVQQMLYDTVYGSTLAFGARSLLKDGEDARTMVGVQMGLFNPQAAGGTVFTTDRARTPATWKTFGVTGITAGTGATVWTPGAGKKFRVMGFTISTSVAGQLILGDNLAATIFMRSATLPAGGIWELGASDLGNGFLSAAANNVLKVDGPTGNVAGMVWGTEE